MLNEKLETLLGRGWHVSHIGIEISQSLEGGGSPFSEPAKDGKHTAADTIGTQ